MLSIALFIWFVVCLLVGVLLYLRKSNRAQKWALLTIAADTLELAAPDLAALGQHINEFALNEYQTTELRRLHFILLSQLFHINDSLFGMLMYARRDVGGVIGHLGKFAMSPNHDWIKYTNRLREALKNEMSEQDFNSPDTVKFLNELTKSANVVTKLRDSLALELRRGGIQWK